MQKKLIAAAVAALASTGAMAQVTMYGVLDAYVAHAKSEGANSTATKQSVDAGLLSGSRLGFKGEEDLGEGMKAVALVELAVNIDSGSTSAVFDRVRQSYVGLTSTSFGRLSLGRQYSPGYFAPGNSDGFASAIIAPQTVLSGMAGANITPGGGARVNNAVNWVSNSMGGLTVNALYGFGEDNKDSNDAAPNRGKQNNTIALGLNFKTGGLVVDGVIHNKNLDDELTQDEAFVGAAYNFGFATIGASWQTIDKEIVGGEVKDTVAQVSAIIPVGKGNVHLSYGQIDRSNVSDDKARSFAVAYTHALGKRTTVYAGYNKTDLDDGNPYAYNGWAGAAVAAGKSSTVLAAGMRLTF